MKILVNGEYLDVPADMKLSVQLQSPFFATEGSFTLPITLPATENNRRILGFIDRLDIVGKQQKTDSTIVHNSFVFIGTIEILSYSPNDGFECTIFLNGSNIFYQFKELQLKDVMYSIRYTAKANSASPASVVPLASIDTSIKPLNEDPRMPDQATADVLTKEVLNLIGYATNDDLTPQRQFEVFPVMTEQGIINDPIQRTRTEGPAMLYDGEYLLGPTGIGYTVFLHLDYVLECVFEHIGRTLNIVYPDFADADGYTFKNMFRRIVILNQTIDALVPGKIYFDTLVPNITCLELIQACQAMFGATFIERNNGVIEMVFIKNILSSSVSTILDKDHIRIEDLAFDGRRMLNVALSHIRHTDDKEYTLEDLAKNYVLTDGKIALMNATDSARLFAFMNIPQGWRLGHVFRTQWEGCRGDVYYIDRLEGVDNANRGKAKLLCKDQFDGFYPIDAAINTSALEEETVNSVLSDTREANTDYLPVYDESKDDNAGTFNSGYFTYDRQLKMPLMPGMKNETCTVTQTQTTTNSNGATQASTKEITLTEDCPLVFAYYLGGQTTSYTGRVRYGSPLNMLSTDNAFDLNAHGMVNTMWEDYAEYIFTGGNTITFAIYITPYEASQLSFDKVYQIHGQRFLLKQVQYTLADTELIEVIVEMIHLI